jgi:hypothetical protein
VTTFDELERMLANKPTTVPALVGQNVLIADIERVQGLAMIPMKFWDMGAIKYQQRIKPDDVVSWPRTVCLAAKWYGDDKVTFIAEWHKGGYRRFMEKAWKLFDQAQIVVGHNMDRFDRKHLNAAWNEIGFPPPSPFKVVDTLKVAWSEFGYESNTMDSLCKRLGITAKDGHYSIAVADAAVAGDKDAQANIESYNIGDIHATEALYNYFRPWIKNHPHNVNGNADDKPVCNRCWQPEMAANGYTLAVVISYRLYRCSVCGANVKTGMHHRAANTRGA